MHSSSPTTSGLARFFRVGPIVMVLGAALVLAGVVQSTSSNLTCGDNSCPTGTVLLAKFNYSNGYVFEKPAGNSHVVTITNASSTGGAWHSTSPVSAILVKGGPSTLLVKIAPPQFSGTFSNVGLPKVGNGKNLPAISNVQFCGPPTPPNTSSSTSTSTTTASSTTSTSTTTPASTTTTTTLPASTTTTEHAGSTTTLPIATTTVPILTTTTTFPTATTAVVAPTTGTTQVTTTTEAATSTTKVAGTTVTAPRTTTTTVPVVTSTTVLKPSGHTLPFTGGNSTPLLALGLVLLATGFTLTLSDIRRRQRSQA